MTEATNLLIRRSTPSEIDAAVDWAAAEGWNPGALDAHCYGVADPAAFLIGLLKGEPVATISVVRYDNRFGFLGFYIVRPEFRGRGLGIQIWNAGLDYLNGCCIGLDGVVEQIPNYEKSGFELAYRHLRFAAPGGGAVPVSGGIVELEQLPFEQVADYDAAFFPSPRPDFLRQWIAQPEATALGVVRDGGLAGYGVVRPCGSGAKIGPLYANDASSAETLFQALRQTVDSNAEVYLDVPDANPAAMQLAKRNGMEVQFECARMYRGERPELPVNRIYGVTSMEIG